MNEMMEKAFGGKKVLITGHTGFKGSWLSLWLLELGAEVMGYALPPEGAHDHSVLLKLERQMDSVMGDIRDQSHLRACFECFQPEVVFHLAAQALVRRSYREPLLTFDTNVQGAANVLETVRQCPSVKALIYVTSDKCYENSEWIWGYRENDRLGGKDPYSTSKAAAEMVFNGYFESYYRSREGLGAASVRAGNVVGGGDWSEDRIIPDCISSLQKGQPIVIRRPRSVRPWQHVLEPLSGYLQLAARLLDQPKVYSGAWNFGPGSTSSCPVEELVRQVIKVWGQGEYRIDIDPEAPHEAGLLYLNWEKAERLLQWRPRWDSTQTIDETVNWYKNFYAGAGMEKFSREQIRKFMVSNRSN